jgi:hypothetical protein
MLVWLEANLHPERLTGRTLAAAITASHEPRSSVDSSTSLGLAWLLHPNGEIEHGGSILGFTADAFFTPSEDLAAVVLSNVGPGTALSAELVGEHLRARLAGRPAVSLATVAIPQTGSVATWIRLSLAYWFTMAAAGVFVLGLAASVQGLAAAILPRRHFVRLSSGLQLATFCVVVGTYCFQPMRPLPSVLLAAQDGGLLTSSPSLWFLGLFQQLSGSPALGPLAEKAWLGLGLAVGGTVIAYGLSYVRAMRYIAEQPDVTATMAAGARWLPSFGSMPSTAIIHFSIRTLARSAQHRLIVAFYWGVGFAFAIFLIKAPRGQQLAEVSGLTAWHETGVPVLVSSVVMMAFAVVAARVAFAIPRDLSANWIFRIMPVGDARQLVDARRWALTLVSVVPVWTLYAITLPWLWPWQPALEHLLALAILGMTFVELAMIGPVKIPATCSYLPGKSHLHLAVCIAAVVLLPLAFEAAEFELAALQAPIRYVSMLVVLCIALFGLRLRTAWAARIDDRLTFDDEPADVPTTIELWDARVAGTSTTRRGPASG